jgi:hypothetical protein
MADNLKSGPDIFVQAGLIYIKEKTIYIIFIYIKRSSLVKNLQFENRTQMSGSQMVFQLPFYFWTQNGHSKNGLVWYSDGDCIYLAQSTSEIWIVRISNCPLA